MSDPAPLPARMLDLAERIFHDTELACFVAGTRIDTASGECPIEAITPGTLVHTADHGMQPVRRVLSKTVSGLGTLAPVRFATGVLATTARSSSRRITACCSRAGRPRF